MSLVDSLNIDQYTLKINEARSLASTVTYADISPMLYYIKAIKQDIDNINNNSVANTNTPPNPPTLAAIYSITSLGI